MPSALGHQFIQFVLAFTGAIVLLYMLLAYYKKQIGGANPNQQKPETQIVVESMQFLEPRKNLYVVRTGQERFLIATSEQNTQLIHALPPLSNQDYENWIQQQNTQPQAGGGVPQTFGERFKLSVKMILNQYFNKR